MAMLVPTVAHNGRMAFVPGASKARSREQAIDIIELRGAWDRTGEGNLREFA